MDHAFSEGLPFEIGDVWRQSTFYPDNLCDTTFNKVDIDLPPLDVQHEYGLFSNEIKFVELDQLNDPGDDHLKDIETETSASFDTAFEDAEPTADVWSLDTTLDGSRPVPCLHTWQGFEKRAAPNAHRVSLLSESEQRPFDVAIQRIEQRPSECGVLPQDIVLRSLYHLALGRSSLFFQWDVSKCSFARTLERVPVSGYSAASSERLIQRTIELGTTSRTLSDFSRSVSSGKYSCPALIALKGAIVKLLDSVERHITKHISHIRSLPQLSTLLDRPHQLLKVVEVSKNSVHGLSSDEDIISVISTQVNELVATQTCFAVTLQALLARITAPWLERLCIDLQLSGDTLNHRSFENEAFENDAAEDDDLSLDFVETHQYALPNFVDKQDHALIVECQRSLATLRKQLPDYKVPVTYSIDINALLWDNGDTKSSMTNHNRTGAFDHQIDLAWANGDAQGNYFETLDSQMSHLPNSLSDVVDDLEEKVETALISGIDSSKNSLGLDRVDFNPIDSLRPTIQAHAKLINMTVLRHVFWSCRLRDHLNLHRHFHLFGNGDFVARLSTALFSDETQSAERRKGNVPTGETMGLRLGTRDEQHWPPASSELRLTLAGILTETYHSTNSAVTLAKGDTKELPGGLSFSIRELPDDEIERVLDTGSIYALDFLRLQYHIPSGLDAVITKSSLQYYDAIFRQLLRMLRMLDITAKLMGRARSNWTNGPIRLPDITKFANEAHHFVSVVMAHIQDLGISSPWQTFLSSIDQVEAALAETQERKDSDVMIGLDDLQQLHDQCLESMRSRTFLRQKHQKVRTAIDDAFTDILQCSTSLDKEDFDAFATLVKRFRDKVTGLLTVLRTTINRPGKVKMDVTTADGDAEAMSMLLAKLDWNGHYSQST